jgi:hypothetical protein
LRNFVGEMLFAIPHTAEHPPLPAPKVLPNELTESALPPFQAEPTNDTAVPVASGVNR